MMTIVRFVLFLVLGVLPVILTAQEPDRSLSGRLMVAPGATKPIDAVNFVWLQSGGVPGVSVGTVTLKNPDMLISECRLTSPDGLVASDPKIWVDPAAGSVTVGSGRAVVDGYNVHARFSLTAREDSQPGNYEIYLNCPNISELSRALKVEAIGFESNGTKLLIEKIELFRSQEDIENRGNIYRVIALLFIAFLIWGYFASKKSNAA